MMIYLFRHGEAEAKAAKDEDRALTRNGVLGAREVAEKFLARAPVIDRAMMSPYERAKQTAVALRRGFPNLRFEISTLMKPNDDVYELINALEHSNAQHVMLVGHNPQLSKLLSLLLDGITETGREIGTGELVCVAMEEVVPGFGELKYSIKPGGA